MIDLSPEIIAKIKALKLLILDVDGVLTDGRLFFDQNGVEYKCFHARDGHGMKLLKQSGVEIAVISGRKSNSVAMRMQNLGIEHVFQGHENKREAFQTVIGELNLAPHQVAHMGDDVIDLPIMTQVGFAVAVADANFFVKQHADWCTTTPGGMGAVREVCDLILQVQGNFDSLMQQYL